MKTTEKSSFALIRRWGPVVLLAVIFLLAPQVLTEFRLSQLGKFLTFAIVAVGLDLIWGYGGMMSLGQGLFFGLGAYGFAMYLKLQSSGDKIPDFMFWSGLKSLPWFWAPFQNPVFAIVAALVIPALLAGVLGYFLFRSRVKGVYFSIITQAFTLLTSIWFVGQQAYTGGTNGITNLGSAKIFGYSLLSSQAQHGFYYLTVACLLGVYVLARWLTSSRFGRLLVAVRDDESRVRFLGYDPVVIKTLVFALSGMIAALAGILFVPQVGIISPSSMGVVPSIEMVVWVALGGRSTLMGAIVGALAVNYGKSFFSESYPDIWQTFLGLLFIGSVLFFPNGVLGALKSASAWLSRRLNGWKAQPAQPAQPTQAESRKPHTPNPLPEVGLPTLSQRTEGGSS